MNTTDLKQIKKVFDTSINTALREQDKRNDKKFATKKDVQLIVKNEIKDAEERLIQVIGETSKEVLYAVNSAMVNKHEFEALQEDVEKLKNN